MAKAKGRSRVRRYFSRVKSRAKKMTIPVALVGGFAVPIARSVIVGQGLGVGQGLRHFTAITTGIDPETGGWNAAYLRLGLLPIIMGALLHKVVGGYLGLNRALARAGVPILRF